MTEKDPFLAALQKHGAGTVLAARDAAQVRGWLSTGNYALNWAISGRFQRGYPLGHVVEIFGDHSTGKSFLVARAVAEAQLAGGHALLDDTEGAFNPEWSARTLGVDVDALAYLQPHSRTVEEHYDAIKAFTDTVRDLWGEPELTRPVPVAAPTPYLLALDSLALLSTEHELESGMDKVSLTRAKLIHRMFRMIGSAISDQPICYLITNHTIANIGGGPYRPTTTPGGGGPKYQASVRLDLRTPSKIKKKSTGEVTGVVIRVIVAKNRIAPPFREVKIAIPFNRPIDSHSGLIETLLWLGLISTSKGHSIVYRGEDTKIPGHKSKGHLDRDLSAARLLQKFPKLLEEADAELAKRELGPQLVDPEDEEE